MTATEEIREVKEVTASRTSFQTSKKLKSPTTPVEAAETAHHTINLALEKLNERVLNVTERKSIGAMKNCVNDYNKVFLRPAIQDAAQELVAFILQKNTGVCEAFQSAVVKVTEISSLVKNKAKVIVIDHAAIDPIETFVVEMVVTAVGRAVKSKGNAVLPLPYPAGLYILSFKIDMKCHKANVVDGQVL